MGSLPTLRAGVQSRPCAARRALASAAVVAAGAAGAAPARADAEARREAPSCAINTVSRANSNLRVPDCAPAFRAAAKPRRRRSGGARALGGDGGDGSGGGGGGGFGGDDSRWWEPQPEQPGGDSSLLFVNTLGALSLLAGVQHVAARATVRCFTRVTPASKKTRKSVPPAALTRPRRRRASSGSLGWRAEPRRCRCSCNFAALLRRHANRQPPA